MVRREREHFRRIMFQEVTHYLKIVHVHQDVKIGRHVFDKTSFSCIFLPLLSDVFTRKNNFVIRKTQALVHSNEYKYLHRQYKSVSFVSWGRIVNANVPQVHVLVLLGEHNAHKPERLWYKAGNFKQIRPHFSGFLSPALTFSRQRKQGGPQAVKNKYVRFYFGRISLRSQHWWAAACPQGGISKSEHSDPPDFDLLSI